VDPFRAYLYRDAHVLFSTKPYTLDKNTLAGKFDPFVHLTNWSINFTKGNKHLAENKPGIGVGCEWTGGQFLRWAEQNASNFKESVYWNEVSRICAHTMHAITKWNHVRRHRKANDALPRVEAFGLDIMMDENCKVWLMEANSQVGLNPSQRYLPNPKCKAKICDKNGCGRCKGIKNPLAALNNKVPEGVVNACMDIMQFDCKKRDLSKTLISLHDILANEEKQES